MTVRKTTILLALLMLANVPTDTVRGADPARFTSGLHIRVDGSLRTLFVEGPAVSAPSTIHETDFTLQMDLDIDIAIGEQRLSRGRHRLRLFVFGKRSWQIVPEALIRKRKNRSDFAMTTLTESERDLHVRFVRMADPRRLQLEVRWGKHRGTVDVIVDPDTAPVTQAPTELDAETLRKERDLLLAAAGDLLDVLKARGRWIGMVAAIRDAAVAPGRPKGVVLSEIEFELTEGSLSLAGKGRTPEGDYDEVGAFGERYKKGPMGDRFTRILVEGGKASKGPDGSIRYWPFTIQGESPSDQWRPSRVPLTSVAGASVLDLVEEIAYLDEWLLGLADADGKRAVTNIRDRLQALLALRRDTGVMVMPEPSPLTKSAGDLLGRYAVKMTIRGATESLLRFLDGIHGWGTLWPLNRRCEDYHGGEPDHA